MVPTIRVWIPGWARAKRSMNDEVDSPSANSFARRARSNAAHRSGTSGLTAPRTTTPAPTSAIWVIHFQMCIQIGRCQGIHEAPQFGGGLAVLFRL